MFLVSESDQDAAISLGLFSRGLRFNFFLSGECTVCSALDSLSTSSRVSLGDNSPSSLHLRLERSGGHMRNDVSPEKLSARTFLSCPDSEKFYGRNAEVSGEVHMVTLFLSSQRL